MEFRLVKYMFLCALLFCSVLCFAWKEPSTKSADSKVTQNNSSAINKAANCAPATSRTQLALNNVNALLEAGGSLWLDRSTDVGTYFVPAESNNSCMYAGSLWLAGVDVNNQLKVAAHQYKRGNDFWTGPLTTIPGSGNGADIRDFGPAEIEPDVCDQYDKFFITTKLEISEFRGWFRCGEDPDCDQSSEYPGYTIPESIIGWPAHGDMGRFQDFYLAPFYDYNDDGVYNPNDGDYPKYDLDSEFDCSDPTNRAARAIFGDINYWWVFNDKGNIHTETNGDPIGMEIRAQAFAFATNDEVNNMTFYNYELINRSTQTLTDTYFGQWADTDIGGYNDDYVGCDVSRGLGFCYNGDNYDNAVGSANGYGSNPPAIGIDFFEGPYQDADGIDNAVGIGFNEAVEGNGIGYGDGIADNERFGMRSFLYMNRSGTGLGSFAADPVFGIDYYNYLRGIWLDGTSFVYGGTGHVSDPAATSVACDFTFPGNSDKLNWGTGGIPMDPWDEFSEGNPEGDRRTLQSAGPFTLEPGALNNITVGVVWARAVNGNNVAAVEAIKIADQKAQALFENCFRIIDGPDAPEITIQELDRELILYLTNPVTSNNAAEDYEVRDPFIIVPDSLIGTPEEWDTRYRFQGYQIFQVKDETVGPSDLENVDVARLLAQVDIKDGIAQLINYEFDEAIGVAIANEMVDGEDVGIRHSFKVTRDLFAQGDNRLINHKTYHYMALAYSHNEYKPYDPDEPALLDGQKKPYLAGRKAPGGGIKSVSGIPHIPAPELGGTVVNTEYGDGPKITRIEGTGNGSLIVDITPESEAAIVANYKLDEVEYQNGKGPVRIKVIDPLNVISGEFELRFIPHNTLLYAMDSATWMLTNLATGEKVTSDQTIAVDNEQLIPEWGISVQIQQYKYYKPYSERWYTDFLEGTIEFSDSSKQWLTGVPDADGATDQNWIRSGTAYEAPNPGNVCDQPIPKYNDWTGYDDEEKYEQILDGTWAPFLLCSRNCENTIVGNAIASSLSGKELINLPSIDVVITKDRSKWTRCAVIEMQTETLLSEGGKSHGLARAGQSVDKYGLPDGTGTGMGWFPGYAIDVETGERLNMAFGEDSWLGGDNGRDMIWNPTWRMFNSVNGDVYWGGKHTIFVFGNRKRSGGAASPEMPAYDDGVYLEDNLVNGTSGNRNKAWRACMWVGQPMLDFSSIGDVYSDTYDFIKTDVKIRLRVAKKYEKYATKGYYTTPIGDTAYAANEWYPLYRFTTTDIATITSNNDTAVSALDLINVVPNPYYAYSAYESNKLDSRIKITNLPDVCNINIYSVGGTHVREFRKDNTITFQDWDLKNQVGIPIASGVYIIHIEAPGIGERIIKWFGAIRPPILDNF
ncbi:MAG: hypothetical protein CL833_03520 [Crocinitomicaceae bacterium]|nr:hypothetical protein [Crocinitomicaceae bacterium]